MARDYSSRRNASTSKTKAKKQNTRRKPAARPKRQPTARSGAPGWVWFLSGLSLAAAVATGMYIFARPGGRGGGEQQVNIGLPQRPAQTAAPAAGGGDRAGNTTPARTGQDASDSADAKQKPRFSFYKMLPKYQVVIPQEEYPAHSGTQSGNHTPSGHESSTNHSTAGHSTASSTPEPTTPTVNEPGSYVIQAGSFSTHADADRRKAELAMLGMSSQIVDINLPSGKTVYRVQSDTIDSSAKLNRLLKRLRDNQIDTMVMREKN